ncbi:hypothetical protein Acr_00g0032750 [Actinidia rufa]|uniref:Late embryogenesis abundant (LEA) hydroxyproline-rich glycoprotein family n=1 Tax=Actinidia rufa TaxID=165716 RepID=A0A7J0DHE2_9ERIC|nr:hypothetical protein Acr_00g0032750 [Actinidia rufa]
MIHNVDAREDRLGRDKPCSVVAGAFASRRRPRRVLRAVAVARLPRRRERPPTLSTPPPSSAPSAPRAATPATPRPPPVSPPSPPPPLQPIAAAARATSSGRNSTPSKREGLLDDDNARRRRSCRCYFLGFLVAFFVLFSFFSLVLWGASRNQKPIVTMKSISFDKFAIQAGNDDSGVATEMVTMNSTVKFVYRNTGTFFGIHVTSTLLDLSYSESQLTLATGSINKFYQSRKSQRTLTVMMQGTRVPLYGGGVDLSSKDGIPTAPVPLTLSFMVRSRAYVLGKLVKPNFKKRVQCSAVLDPKKMNVAMSLKNSCI